MSVTLATPWLTWWSASGHSAAWRRWRRGPGLALDLDSHCAHRLVEAPRCRHDAVGGALVAHDLDQWDEVGWVERVLPLSSSTPLTNWTLRCDRNCRGRALRHSRANIRIPQRMSECAPAGGVDGLGAALNQWS